MRFRKWPSTTGKVTVSDVLREETGLTFHYDIVSKVKTFKTPSSLLINLEHTPSKFLSGNRSTQVMVGSETQPIAGSTDKRIITLTIRIILKGDCLPIQIIYGRKTSQSIPRVSFIRSFCICVNEKHYMSKAESLTLIDKVIITYVQNERNKLAQANDEALLIRDVFREQMTNAVLERLKKNIIIVSLVPANMTHLF